MCLLHNNLVLIIDSVRQIDSSLLLRHQYRKCNGNVVLALIKWSEHFIRMPLDLQTRHRNWNHASVWRLGQVCQGLSKTTDESIFRLCCTRNWKYCGSTSSTCELSRDQKLPERDFISSGVQTHLWDSFKVIHKFFMKIKKKIIDSKSSLQVSFTRRLTSHQGQLQIKDPQWAEEDYAIKYKKMYGDRVKFDKVF